MKIAITGKGGAGKTTISATLARILARRGHKVLAIDGDPNPNLAVALGVPEKERARLLPLPADLMKQTTDDQGVISLSLTRTKEQVQSECAAVGPDGVSVLMGSQVERAGAG